jgi:hypothetical protein
MTTIWEKVYKRKERLIRAVQFDGTQEHAEYLTSEYIGIYAPGADELYFTDDGSYKMVYNGDWIVVDGMNALEIIDRDYFADNYEEVETH